MLERRFERVSRADVEEEDDAVAAERFICNDHNEASL
jgi:hypothetical protein